MDRKLNRLHLIFPFKIAFTAVLTFMYCFGYSQTGIDTALKAGTLRADSKYDQQPKDTLSKQYDVGDLYHTLFHPNKKVDPTKKKSGITVIPNIGSNPTIGSQIGIKAVAGRKLGSDPATLMSVAATSASITTKGIIYVYLVHNVYTPGNKWNFQGSLVGAKTVTPDFGLGIGRNSGDIS